ncbi:hypothetical protein GUJ93_ZPchr0007g3422 [Zizania palustris]|uniref:Uncharacterized protein n=1 Tax=Zizania palustris TaxID=103762 RepID=A0A8J5TKB6_ZIZPA|nr:hypothetical protein GUJ93_ZPchr0007g3422 [Zizania palustris]
MMSGSGYSSLPKAPGSVPVSPPARPSAPVTTASPLLSILTLVSSPRASQAATGPDPPAIKFTDSNIQTFCSTRPRARSPAPYHPPTDADGQIRSPFLVPIPPIGSSSRSDCLCGTGMPQHVSSKYGAGSRWQGGGTGSDDAGQGGWFRMFSVAVSSPTSRTSEEPRPVCFYRLTPIYDNDSIRNAQLADAILCMRF